MLKKLPFFLFIFGTVLSFAQTTSFKIGTNPYTIDISALLELESVSKGLLLPRLNTSQRDAIVAPAEGLIIYNSTTKQLEINKGTSAAPIWSGADVPDATTSLKGKIKLANDLGGTADAPTVPGLATKESTIAPGATTDYWRGDKTWQPLTKASVGLGNVDNTSDANKPVSTATQTALDLKANLVSPTFTGTVSGITKAMVGLSNVDNTSDANKPVSTATQAALDLKANLVSPTFTGTVSGITKAMVGLSNVDNTSDANKPVSTATQAALNTMEVLSNKSTSITTDAISTTKYPSVKIIKDYVDSQVISAAIPDATTTVKGKLKLAGDLSGTADLPTVPGLATKENTIVPGTNSQYFRGDKSWRDFYTDVRASPLTGLSTSTNAVIGSSDSVLTGLGKLQAQINLFASSAGAVIGFKTAAITNGELFATINMPTSSGFGMCRVEMTTKGYGQSFREYVLNFYVDEANALAVSQTGTATAGTSNPGSNGALYYTITGSVVRIYCSHPTVHTYDSFAVGTIMVSNPAYTVTF